MRVAILGAGSYVSRAILPGLLRSTDWEALLHTRAPEPLTRWAVGRGLPRDRISVLSSNEFGSRAFDVVVNFVGAGDPRLVNEMGEDILAVTAEWDRRALQVLRQRPSTGYIFASSGVATGEDFTLPREPGAPLKAPPPDDYYARAKAEAEARHREHRDLSIVDLRLYSFYSAEMGARLGYLVCAMLQALLAGSVLTTDAHDIARDYLHPDDFVSAIIAAVRSTPLNGAYDLASVAPVHKFELLRRFGEKFDLQWQVRSSTAKPNKLNYYSRDRALSGYGFVAKRSALEAVMDQATAFLADNPRVPA
jgi:nucleoside-diphosphate-sugar epimerase